MEQSLTKTFIKRLISYDYISSSVIAIICFIYITIMGLIPFNVSIPISNTNYLTTRVILLILVFFQSGTSIFESHRFIKHTKKKIPSNNLILYTFTCYLVSSSLLSFSLVRNNWTLQISNLINLIASFLIFVNLISSLVLSIKYLQHNSTKEALVTISLLTHFLLLNGSEQNVSALLAYICYIGMIVELILLVIIIIKSLRKMETSDFIFTIILRTSLFFFTQSNPNIVGFFTALASLEITLLLLFILFEILQYIVLIITFISFFFLKKTGINIRTNYLIYLAFLVRLFYFPVYIDNSLVSLGTSLTLVVTLAYTITTVVLLVKDNFFKSLTGYEEIFFLGSLITIIIFNITSFSLDLSIGIGKKLLTSGELLAIAIVAFDSILTLGIIVSALFYVIVDFIKLSKTKEKIEDEIEIFTGLD